MKYGMKEKPVKGAKGKGRVTTSMDCWDGRKQAPTSKGKGFGSK